MTELHWTPDEIGRMTLPQLVCLIQKQSPGGEMLDSIEDYRAAVEREAVEEKAWDD